MHIFHRNNLDVLNISIDRYQEIYPAMKYIKKLVDSNNYTLFAGLFLNVSFW